MSSSVKTAIWAVWVTGPHNKAKSGMRNSVEIVFLIAAILPVLSDAANTTAKQRFAYLSFGAGRHHRLNNNVNYEEEKTTLRISS